MIVQFALVVLGGLAAIVGFLCGYPDHGVGVAAAAGFLFLMSMVG